MTVFAENEKNSLLCFFFNVLFCPFFLVCIKQKCFEVSPLPYFLSLSHVFVNGWKHCLWLFPCSTLPFSVSYIECLAEQFDETIALAKNVKVCHSLTDAVKYVWKNKINQLFFEFIIFYLLTKWPRWLWDIL